MCSRVLSAHLYVDAHLCVDVHGCRCFVEVRGQILKGSSLLSPWVPRTEHKFRAASISACCATSPALTLIVVTCATSEPKCGCIVTYRTLHVFSVHLKSVWGIQNLQDTAGKKQCWVLETIFWFQIFCSDYFSQISVLAVRLTAILKSLKENLAIVATL